MEKTDKGHVRYEELTESLQQCSHVMACSTFSFLVKLTAPHGPTHHRVDGNGTLMSQGKNTEFDSWLKLSSLYSLQ